MTLDLPILSSTTGNSGKEKFFPLFLHLKLFGAPIKKHLLRLNALESKSLRV